MAASMTIKEYDYLTTMAKIVATWTSAADGSVSGTTVNKFTGTLERLITVPGTAGVQPSDNYDIVANDADGVDALVGGGANRDNVNTEQVLGTSLGCVLESALTFAVTNAGDSKQGTIVLYIKK